MILSITLGLLAVSAFALVRSIRSAPEGWEDRDGFHEKPASGEVPEGEPSRPAAEVASVPHQPAPLPRG